MEQREKGKSEKGQPEDDKISAERDPKYPDGGPEPRAGTEGHRTGGGGSKCLRI